MSASIPRSTIGARRPALISYYDGTNGDLKVAALHECLLHALLPAAVTSFPAPSRRNSPALGMADRRGASGEVGKGAIP